MKENERNKIPLITVCPQGELTYFATKLNSCSWYDQDMNDKVLNHLVNSCRYKEAFASLVTQILHKIQFRYNQSHLEELDDDTLDDDVRFPNILCLLAIIHCMFTETNIKPVRTLFSHI